MFKWLHNKLFKIMLIVGIALIVSAFVSNISLNSFLDHAKDGVAIIDEIEGTRFLTDEPNVSVYYFVDGEKYEGNLKYYDDSWNEGDEVAILYNPDHPKNMRAKEAESPVKKLYTWGIILCAASAVLYVITSVMRKRRMEKKAEKKAMKKLLSKQDR